MRDLLESVHLCVRRGNRYLFYLFTACLNVLPWWQMHMLWKMSITNNKSRSTLTLGNTHVGEQLPQQTRSKAGSCGCF